MSEWDRLVERYRTAVVAAVIAWCITGVFVVLASTDFIWRDTGLPEKIEAECIRHAEKVYTERDAAAQSKGESASGASENDGYYKARDHCLSRRAAIASEWQAHYGKLQAGVAFCTLAAAMGAAAIAWLAFREARHQAEAAWRSVSNSQTLERAALRIEGDGPITPLPFARHIVIRFVNVGNSAAQVLATSVNHVAGDDALPEAPQYADRRLRTHEFVAKGGTFTVVRFPPEDAFRRAFSDDESAFIWGYIDYRDVFGRAWRRGFAYGFSFILVLPTEEGDERSAVWSRIEDDAYNFEREIADDLS